MPGHVFPLQARSGGVLVRAGQTEGSVDLARLAGMNPAGVICEIIKDDGTMARVPDLIEFCRTHNMKMLTVAELIRYRMANERYVHRVGEALVDTLRRVSSPTREVTGENRTWRCCVAIYPITARQCWSGCTPNASWETCLAPRGATATPTIEGSLQAIAAANRGALIYLHQTSKGFSVENVANRSFLTFHRDKALPTLPESERKAQRGTGIGAQILSDLDLRPHQSLNESSEESSRT